MAVIKNYPLYEVLARFNEDGLLQGCHKILRTIVVDDETGETYNSTIGGAEEVTQAEAADLISQANLAPEDEEPPANPE